MTKVTVLKKEVSHQTSALREMGYSVLTIQERQDGEQKMNVADIFFEPKIKIVVAGLQR